MRDWCIWELFVEWTASSHHESEVAAFAKKRYEAKDVVGFKFVITAYALLRNRLSDGTFCGAGSFLVSSDETPLLTVCLRKNIKTTEAKRNLWNVQR